MLKRKRIYICDHCGMIALEEGKISKCAPKGWVKHGKEDLCPTCSILFHILKKGEPSNAEN